MESIYKNLSRPLIETTTPTLKTTLMKKFATTFFLFVILSLSANAQVANYRLEEMADDATRAFTYYLGLSSSKQVKVKDIYYKYFKQLTDNGWKNEYLIDIKKAEAGRDSELKKIFTEREYRIYVNLQESAKVGHYEYYDEIETSIEENPLLTKALKDYFSHNIFPVLSNLKFVFEEELSREDNLELDENNKIFSQVLDSLLENKVTLTRSNIRVLVTPTRSIDEVLTRNDVAYNKVLAVILANNERWKNGINKIYLEYNYTPEQIEVLNSPQEILSAYGVNNLMDQIKFVQIEPFNEAKYLSDVSKFRYFTEKLAEFISINESR